MNQKNASFFSIFLFIICLIVLSGSSKAEPPSQDIQTGRMRIISLSPNITEVLFALGLDNEIVGVTEFCKYPKAALEKAKVGGYGNPDLETIVSLKPTIIIMLNFSAAVKDKLRGFNIETLVVTNETVEEVLDSITKIGQATQRDDSAERLILSIRTKVDSVRKKYENQPKPGVLLGIGRNPEDITNMYVAGPGTFLNELLEIAGGKNIVSDVEIKYPKISLEEIITRNPEIILEPVLQVNPTPEYLEKFKTSWAQLPGIEAVKNGEIHFLFGDFILIPGPRMLLTLDQIVKILHPEDGKTAIH